MPAAFKDYYTTLGVAQDRERGRHQEGVSQAGAQIPSRRREGQEDGRGKIQGDQRGLRSPERSGQAQEIRRTRRELAGRGADSGRRRAGRAGAAIRARARARRSFISAAPASAISSSSFLAAAAAGGRGVSRRRARTLDFRPTTSDRAAARHRGRHPGHARRSHARRDAADLAADCQPAHGPGRDALVHRCAFRRARPRAGASACRATAAPGAAAARRAIFSCACASRRIPTFARAAQTCISTSTWRRGKRCWGEQIVVPGLNGAIKVRIPAGTQNGQQLRIRGQGLPIGKTGGKGDLYVISHIQVPPEMNDEEKKHWEKLRETSSYRPRGNERS